ncbi:hypothetical protein BAU01nite_30790 [Brevibacterium aurantiacum]|nr:hypothetical protein BAU01nite_30790 [Brevibacterium aurantiacum]
MPICIAEELPIEQVLPQVPLCGLTKWKQGGDYLLADELGMFGLKGTFEARCSLAGGHDHLNAEPDDIRR